MMVAAQRNLTCFRCNPLPTSSRALFSTSSALYEDEKKKKIWPFHLTMSEDQKKRKEEKIEEMKQEEPPKTLFAKVKYYFKRYWYIAVPAHAVSCSAWFAAMYAIVHSGVDVIWLLETLHIPDLVVEKVRNTPPAAGELVVAFILYKVVMPIRYATTLVLIQLSFWTLRRMGKLRTAREVEYKVRTEYEKNKKYYGRRMYRYRNLGVRSVAKKSSLHQQPTNFSNDPNKKNP
ncbi:unnamed protein product [Caenorhabditis auriculariae]|uniref:DUF1279 domain-containing protein n=1 Tax=Caenorhabditis auriculariae TaxID=2777116 RepID=A0A8S1HQ33_9PELO|nr:unnamed protein product [Caenorhabditis auriculariae]